MLFDQKPQHTNPDTGPGPKLGYRQVIMVFLPLIILALIVVAIAVVFSLK